MEPRQRGGRAVRDMPAGHPSHARALFHDAQFTQKTMQWQH